MKNFLLFVFLLFALPTFSVAQNISAQVLDYNTRQPIPYASIVYAENRGVITNDEGKFSFTAEDVKTYVFSISSLGYETLEIKAEGFNEDIILLKPSTIELREVFLSNKNLSGKEIIQKIKEGIRENYNFNLTQKRFFFRESNISNIRQFDLEVDKSTIPGIDQELMNKIAANVPKESDGYKEVLGDFFGNYDFQKLKIIKAANLHNPKSTTSLDELTDQLEDLFKNNLKEKSYLKIRSGIIGIKVSADELQDEVLSSKDDTPKVEKTAEEKEKAQAKKEKGLQRSTQSEIAKMLHSMFWNKDIPLNVFEKSNRYRFTVEGYTIMDTSTVYIVTFEPKRGADYKGKLYVNTLDYGVHRIDYENVKPLKKFRLFGISTAEDVYRGKMIFAKDGNGKYNPQYIEQERGESFGIDRPLTIIEKNKFVKGRRKQNELDLDIKIKVSEVDKYELVVYENNPLDQLSFEELDITEKFEYRTFKKYNPEFWNGYNIIEPNTAIKAFTALEKK